MKVLDLTLPTPEENLACDEALLEACESGAHGEILRFWKASSTFVVLGYSNSTATEVHEKICRKACVPILRRVSGGGTVLQGPGCLNYALFLEISKNPELKNVTSANRFIMERHRDALSTLLKKEIRVQGHTDLTMNGLKFSGNSQRRKRRFLLFHGTFLLDFDLKSVEKFLKMPSKEPDYRKSRAHEKFLTNLRVPAEKIKEALKRTWAHRTPSSGDTLDPEIESAIQKLVAENYSRVEWNFKF